MPGQTDPLAAAIASMSQYVLADATLGETLEAVTRWAMAAIAPADAVGITLLEQGRRPVTVVASGSVPRRVDQAQYDEDRGPCLDAYRRRTVIRVGDTSAVAQSWPAFSRAATETGVGSTLSLPLVAGNEALGAFNTYAKAKYAFSEGDVQRASLFAAQASVVLANASAYWDAKDLADNLSAAMQSRAAIEQAKGKLMAWRDCTAEEAFGLLVQASQRSNTKLRDIADRIVNGPVSTWQFDETAV